MNANAGDARFRRLRSSIDMALKSTEDDAALAASALYEAYVVFYPESRLLAEDAGVLAEFDRLFGEPGAPPKQTGDLSSGFDPFEAKSETSRARATLGRLSGWLAGFIDD